MTLFAGRFRQGFTKTELWVLLRLFCPIQLSSPAAPAELLNPSLRAQPLLGLIPVLHFSCSMLQLL